MLDGGCDGGCDSGGCHGGGATTEWLASGGCVVGVDGVGETGCFPACLVDGADALVAAAEDGSAFAEPPNGAAKVAIAADGVGVGVPDASGWPPAWLMLMASTAQPTTAATDASDDMTRPRDMWPVCQV